MLSDTRNVEEILPATLVDAGCAAGFEVLHRYVEEVLAGSQPARSYPGLEAAVTFGDAPPSAL